MSPWGAEQASSVALPLSPVAGALSAAQRQKMKGKKIKNKKSVQTRTINMLTSDTGNNSPAKLPVQVYCEVSE